MADSSSQPHAPAALLDNEPDVLRRASCPMCHTPASVTQDAVEAGAGWRCARCGQHWDATRLAAVAAYAVWTAEHDRVGSL
jgi:ribosomal protein L37AE/L43A